ncbi:MAG: solute-binding protein [Chloroflexi bacterium]|nr:solute-binding protein [Chloroflexota bacterium]
MRRQAFVRTAALVALVFVLVTGCAPAVPPPTTAAESTSAPTAVPATADPSPEPVTEEPTEEAEPVATGELILATTTSTQDSGLLEYLLPHFEQQYGVKVNVIAVGTGQAIQLGKDGNADVLLVHARSQEDAFMDTGDGVRREDVMYNDFVVLGPADDPAAIAGSTDAVASFTMIAESEAEFISRGDESGTHSKEKAIWAVAEIEPAGDWYVSAGQGMGAVLTMADEQLAYTLSDRATYLARTLEGTQLEILVEGDPVLFNPYGVIAVNPDKGEHIQAELADLFIDWLVSLPTQAMIAEFGVDQFGGPLFVPDSAAWRSAQAGESTADVTFQLTGLVDTELVWSEEEIRALDTIETEYTNKDGETSTHAGVPLIALLDQAGVGDSAAALVIVAHDGYSAQLTLDEVLQCAGCILAFQDDGTFSTVMPDFPGNVQVREVVEIQVQ